MGVFVPQVVTEDRASGAQVIDGSLRFKGEDNHLVRTPSASNRRTFTWSSWHKRTKLGDDIHTIFNAAPSSHASDPAISYLVFEDHNTLRFFSYWSSTIQADIKTNALFRDVSAWYHVVLAVDTTASTSSDRMKLYVNGQQITSFANESYPSQDLELYINANVEHKIGEESVRDRYEYAGHMSQCYFIDGQQLDPSYFGFTDPLTNVWRPKKYEGTYGTNGFYLPMDGNSLIGEDKSGNGNDWTPVKFGHVSLDKATGGKPILRTVSGGNWGAAPLTERKTYAVTVANDGGNKYFLDGVNYTSTTIPLLRGGTYKFDQSDSTNSGHPLRFATAADAAGSTEYTSGVSQTGTPGSAGAYTVITVPHDAPDTLYYYCTNHNGMGGATSNSTDETKTDLYTSSLVLALPLAGDVIDETDQINTARTQLSFTDAGSTSATDYNFYGASRDFDGSNDFLKASIPNSDSLHLQASSWTVECWFNADALPGGNDVYLAGVRVDASSNANNCWNIRIYNNVIEALWVTGGTQYKTVSPYAIKANKWTHVAYVRDGNEQRLYQDGVLVATTSHTTTPNLNTSSFLEIGGRTGSGFFNGKIQDLRIYSGVAKYTEDFLVGSTKPDVLLDSPSGISYRSESEKITDGAVSFYANDDYLALESGSDLQFGSGDFTIECYVYPNTLSNYDPIIDNGSIAGNNQHDWRLYLGSAGEVWFDIEHSNGTYFNGSGASAGVSYGVVAKKWNHIAITRSGNTVYTFVDGIQKASTSFSGTIDSDYTTAYIGADNMVNGTMYSFDGFISNVRVLKGTALYTSDFTPPREPLTAVTNTKLLCCQSSTDANRPTVSPASTVNDGTDFSTNQVTGSAGLSGIPNLFNGQLGNYLQPDSCATVTDSADNYILWTPTTGVPYTSKVEVWCYAPNGYNITNTYSVNGGAEVSFTGGAVNYNNNTWITVATGSGTINSIKIRLQRSGSISRVQWGAVRIDGVILVDNCTNTPVESYYYASPTPFNANSTDISAVRGQESGYCTLNPLDRGTSYFPTLSDGNLKSASPNNTQNPARGTLATTSGKWYFEGTCTARQYNPGIGVMSINASLGTGDNFRSLWGTQSAAWYSFTGGSNTIYSNGSNSSYATAFATNDTIMVAYDVDAGKIWFGKNGIWNARENPAAGTNNAATFTHTDPITPFIDGSYSSSPGDSWTLNFGQKPFKYNPPEGFGPLCFANLPRPTSSAGAMPTKHFNTVLYNGTAVVGRSVTGVGFKPDLVWIKNRANGVANSWHSLNDSITGERLFPNETIGLDNPDVLSYLDDGFILTYGTYVNYNGGTYAAWCWKAGDDDEIITYTTKVVSDSGNKYRFDDFGTSAVTLELAEGQTYIFDQSDSSNSGHPIRFSTTSDGTHGGGSEYTTGVVTEGTPGSAGAKTTITVASGAPTLYYYCSVHSGMGGQANTNTTKGYSNFDGTIQSRITANTDAGFSICKWQRGGNATATIGHGLNEAPELILSKADGTENWAVYHIGSGNTGRLRLNNNTAFETSSQYWNDTTPGNTVFTVGNGINTNQTNDMMAYCWHSVDGYSKIGSYTGNGTTDGPFVYCGFRPAFILIGKTAVGAGWNWQLRDSARDPFNVNDGELRVNTDEDENASSPETLDFLSNGFKPRSANGSTNQSGYTYIYAAFAGVPTMNLYGGACPAI